MNIQKKIRFGFFLSVLCFFLFSVSAAAQEAPQEREAGGSEPKASPAFSKELELYAYNAYQCPVRAFYSPEENTYFLILTNETPLFLTPLFYSGREIALASAGVIDYENHKISGCFEESGDSLILTDTAGESYRIEALQPELPSLYIRLNGVDLETIHADKEKKYPGNTLLLTSRDGIGQVAAERVEIKGRGNTSWLNYDKKAYQIKFPAAVSVLGMKEAQKWVLLSNSSDAGMLKNYLVFQFAQKLGMLYVPDFAYVNLWIDGEYLGLYLIGEKVEIGENRLPLTNPYGVLVELDNGFYESEEDWFFSEELGCYFVRKETVAPSKDTVSAELAFRSFQNALENYCAYMEAHDPAEITLEDLSAMIDVDSWAKYYLINEYMLNWEGFITSYYWYMDGPGDVLHMGPIWDFDSCMDRPGSTDRDYIGYQYRQFRELLDVPAFKAYVVGLRNQYDRELKELPAIAGKTAGQIRLSAQADDLKWRTLGKLNPKGWINPSTYEEAVENTVNWLIGRSRDRTMY